jgi:predicted ATPase
VAEPNQVVVASATYQLLGTSFEYEDLGMHELKGIAQPVQAWRAVRERDIHSRYETRRVGGGSPLVGRQEELGLLLRSWEASKEGHGQAILIQGEAGIGKSRLVDALRELITGQNYLWVVHRCSPYHTQSALHPVIEQIKRALSWEREDGAALRLEKLERSLAGYGFASGEVVPLIAALLSLPLPKDRYPALNLTPNQQRQMTLDAAAGWLLEEAERRPVLQLWEDIHWADPSTVELLGMFIEQAPTAAMLNVVTFRPEFVPPWGQRSHLLSLTLNRLERAEVEKVVFQLVQGNVLPDEVVTHITDKADGVPLFIEELTKTVIESGLLEKRGGRYELDGALAELHIPATLQDSLMARLDRLPDVRRLAQLGSVLGREFAYDMLCSLAAMDEPQLQDGLGRLVAAELLYQRGRPPKSRYIFKHALIQDAAYQSLLKRSRQQCHGKVAEMLETQYPEFVSSQPELVAHHYTEAGSAERAIEYWKTAGLKALGRSASHEAVSHLTMGLNLIESLPRTRELARQELAMQMGLGPALLAARSFADPAVEQAFIRAIELCESLDDRPRACLATRGQQVYHLMRGETVQSLQLAERLLRLAEEDPDKTYVVGGCHAVGQTRFLAGEFRSANEVLEKGAILFSRDPRQVDGWPGGQPGEQCRCYAAFSSWMLGYPQRALEHAAQALSISQAGGNRFSLANTEVFVAMAHVLQRDAEAAREHAETGITMAAELRTPVFGKMCRALRGSALAMQGEIDDGLAEMRRGIDEYRALGMQAWIVLILALHAEASVKRNDLSEGRRSLVEAASSAKGTGQLFWDAEIHRLEGELRVAHRPAGDEAAEICFQNALNTARAQAARSLELRAATSLGRLWRAQGRRADARDLVAPILGWFTEGFDTSDLKDAKALLDSLP